MAFSGGSGTVNDPYLVSTRQDIIDKNSYPSGHFRMINDIDMLDLRYNSPGGVTFTGVFDGGGFELSNFKIYATSGSRAGLFGILSGAVVKNLTIRNAYSEGTWPAQGGIIAGSALSGSLIQECHVTGSISCPAESGGLVGTLRASQMLNCSSDVTISSSGYSLGGLCGTAYSGSRIFRCKAKVDITSPASSLGGLVGGSVGSSVEECYSTGILKIGGDYSGGICGSFSASISPNNNALIRNCFSRVLIVSNTPRTYYRYAGIAGGASVSNDPSVSGLIENCYWSGSITAPDPLGAAVGGIVGINLGKPVTSAANNFYDTDISGVLPYPVGDGRGTSWMKTPENFIPAGWDFDTVWVIPNPGTDYPLLQWDAPAPSPGSFVEPVKEPKILIRWRNDGKSNWTNYREINLGDIGQTEIVKRICGLGQYRTRQYEIICTSGVPITISGFEES